MQRSALKRSILTALADDPVSNVTTLAYELQHLRPAVSRALGQLRHYNLVQKQGRTWMLTKEGRKLLEENQLALRIASESMAHWWYDATKELGPQYGLTLVEEDVSWDTIAPENPVKQFLIALCAKFLSENAVYNGDSEELIQHDGGDDYKTFQGT